MANNITYLFGAGASAQAIPTVVDMNSALYEMASIIKRHSQDILKNSDQKTLELVLEFASDLRDLGEEGFKFRTIDTYAKKLVLQEDIDALRKVKRTLSIFFPLWQHFHDRDNYGSIDGEEMSSILGLAVIDQRYLTLLSNILRRGKKTIEIPENINFLTWNYDFQLEMAINSFAEYENPKHLFADFKIYPNVQDKENTDANKIVHLNGIAGIYEIPSESKKRNWLFNRSKSNDLIWKKLIDIIFFIESLNQESVNIDNMLSFAWENNPVANAAKENAKRILSETDVLVVIGYSFPSFNLETDRLLINSLINNNRIKKIFYQDLKADPDILSASFGIPHNTISLHSAVDQFLIPRQYL